MSDSKRVFRKFSDFKKEKVAKEPTELDLSTNPGSDELPMNPNLSNDNTKKEELMKTNLQPTDSEEVEGEVNEDNNVKTIGKVAKFPKNVKASKAINFLENVKISKKSIWYLMIEKQDSELQLVKYNYNEGVDLNKFVGDLKKYYITKYKDNKSICESISKLAVEGNDKYSMIKNIPPIDVDGRKLISKITEDLIRLLSI